MSFVDKNIELNADIFTNLLSVIINEKKEDSTKMAKKINYKIHKRWLKNEVFLNVKIG